MVADGSAPVDLTTTHRGLFTIGSTLSDDPAVNSMIQRLARMSGKACGLGAVIYPLDGEA